MNVYTEMTGIGAINKVGEITKPNKDKFINNITGTGQD